MKISKASPYWIFAITQTVFALGIFINEVMAIYNRFPGGNYPIEHRSSWIKVILFCCVAIIGCFILWLFDAKNKWKVLLPSFWLVMPLAIVFILLGAMVSHYLAFMGWCCEQPLAFFFGFPFSFLLGVSGFLYPELQPYENYGLLKIIIASEPQVHWRFLPYEFFLDFLFWTNVTIALLSLLALLRQKAKLLKVTPNPETQSERY